MVHLQLRFLARPVQRNAFQTEPQTLQGSYLALGKQNGTKSEDRLRLGQGQQGVERTAPNNLNFLLAYRQLTAIGQELAQFNALSHWWG